MTLENAFEFYRSSPTVNLFPFFAGTSFIPQAQVFPPTLKTISAGTCVRKVPRELAQDIARKSIDSGRLLARPVSTELAGPALIEIRLSVLIESSSG